MIKDQRDGSGSTHSTYTKAQNHAGPEDAQSSSVLCGYQACMRCMYTCGGKELTRLKYPLLFIDGFYNHRRVYSHWTMSCIRTGNSLTPCNSHLHRTQFSHGHKRSSTVTMSSTWQQCTGGNALEYTGSRRSQCKHIGGFLNTGPQHAGTSNFQVATDDPISVCMPLWRYYMSISICNIYIINKSFAK